ncbi:hypothetical protein StoSoilB13_05490 [Arthrobacter sp. StoSoilB13]|nr:hypothetical protein StoSoilB13_05490 [Arthrobacter sp. StoSoilB13]
MSHSTPFGTGQASAPAGPSTDPAVPTYPEPMDAISMDAVPSSPAPSRVKDNPEGMPTKVVAGVSLAVLAITFMLNAMDRQVFFPLLGTISTEYGFSLQAGGLLATIFTLGMAIAGIPAGFLVERFSRKTVLIVSIAIYSLGTLATPLAASWGDMAVYRVISGLGEGMQAAALFAAVGSFFHLRRGLALGILGFAFGLGATFGARPRHHVRRPVRNVACALYDLRGTRSAARSGGRVHRQPQVHRAGHQPDRRRRIL